jgi:hypothetical protein
MRTTEEISKEIAMLNELVERLPTARRNLRIVIQTLVEGASVDDVYNQYDTEDNEFQYALDAAQWASGDQDTPPSQGWD